jgi:predicted permease
MLAVFSITIPFFAIIGCGFAAEHFRVLGPASRAGLNNFVFYFALPVLIFGLMARSDIGSAIDPNFFLAYLAASFVLFFPGLAVGRYLFGLKAGEAAVQSVSGVYGNTGYVGLPLSILVLGDAAGLPVILTLTMDIAIMAPLTMAVIEAGRSGGAGVGTVLARTIKTLLKNPIIGAIVAGTLVSIFDVELPEILLRFVDLLGAAAGPCALFALGASLVGNPISSGIGEVAYMCVIKLIIHPLVLLVSMTMIFEVDPFWAKAALLSATMPVAATVFVLAQQYETYIRRCSTAVLISTIISVGTVTYALTMLE